MKIGIDFYWKVECYDCPFRYKSVRITKRHITFPLKVHLVKTYTKKTKNYNRFFFL